MAQPNDVRVVTVEDGISYGTSFLLPRMLLRTADRLGISRFHLVGHSMSGPVAQKVALAGASRIQSMTLFSPVPPTGFHADEVAMKALNAVIDEDEAAARDQRAHLQSPSTIRCWRHRCASPASSRSRWRQPAEERRSE
jgi:pimeloyl-ACP methyl ester carboxylesterase